ncbi:hypothetical protein ACFS5L_30705 [Streptomyces phyllanthi]|uniref:Uncharacterized protein n=1 Tax=Streptomyces phyllanthi TaxID=1803180 RepID=A0A5N8WBF5_9ACTN|nr:hypothetical protein [Streptomyces phyllanthi]MPY43758.1 hypothetical protein [Streptomyces phyllanthi]
MLLIVLLPACVAAVFAFVGYGLRTLDREGLRGSGPGPGLRALGALAGAGAAAVYVWGLLHVVGSVVEAEDGGTNSSPIRPCRMPGREADVVHVVDYSVQYMPLRFVCEDGDGDGYASDDVPGYINPVVVALALTGAALAIAAGFASEHRARAGGGDRS